MYEACNWGYHDHGSSLTMPTTFGNARGTGNGSSEVRKYGVIRSASDSAHWHWLPHCPSLIFLVYAAAGARIATL